MLSFDTIMQCAAYYLYELTGIPFEKWVRDDKTNAIYFKGSSEERDDALKSLLEIFDRKGFEQKDNSLIISEEKVNEIFEEVQTAIMDHLDEYVAWEEQEGALISKKGVPLKIQLELTQRFGKGCFSFDPKTQKATLIDWVAIAKIIYTPTIRAESLAPHTSEPNVITLEPMENLYARTVKRKKSSDELTRFFGNASTHVTIGGNTPSSQAFRQMQSTPPPIPVLPSKEEMAERLLAQQEDLMGWIAHTPGGNEKSLLEENLRAVQQQFEALYSSSVASSSAASSSTSTAGSSHHLIPATPINLPLIPLSFSSSAESSSTGASRTVTTGWPPPPPSQSMPPPPARPPRRNASTNQPTNDKMVALGNTLQDLNVRCANLQAEYSSDASVSTELKGLQEWISVLQKALFGQSEQPKSFSEITEDSGFIETILSGHEKKPSYSSLRS